MGNSLYFFSFLIIPLDHWQHKKFSETIGKKRIKTLLGLNSALSYIREKTVWLSVVTTKALADFLESKQGSSEANFVLIT